MHKVIVLGAGMVGKAMALDMASEYDVTAIDIDDASLEFLASNYGIKTQKADVNDSDLLADIIKPFDLVISAVPGFLGWKTINTVIECGKNLVDISFLPEDVLPLDEIARAKGVTAVTDCGVAPGIPNIIAGYHYERSKIRRFEYMVGGLPVVRQYPFEYKAPFSPCDVIEEYTRPARFIENGVIVTRPAMSDAELVDFVMPGTLEAFNSDGLRSLLFTLPGIPFMKEKTLRYPGHIGLIKAFRDSGFFGKEPVIVNGTEVIPFEVTSQLLKEAWKPGPEEREFTVMKIIVEFEDGDRVKTITYNLFDEYDELTGISSMARTTGYTCTAAASMILQGKFNRPGLFPPEKLGTDKESFNFIFDYLSQRGINLICTEM